MTEAPLHARDAAALPVPPARPELQSPSAPTGLERTEGALARGVLFAYSVPRVGIGLVGVVVSLYLAKYATDVLLIAPAAMGAIHALSRLWDGITDPIAGYLSDRTRARRGRRRSWMLASAVPLMVAVILLWSPPAALGGWALVLWMGVAYLLYETAQTLFLVPHGALGVELSHDYHERTRLFGWQHVGLMIGTLGGLAVLTQLTDAENPRQVALVFAVSCGLALAASVVFAALRLPERAEYQGRGGERVWKSFGDVFRNPHARVLLLVYGVESLGTASVLVLVPYVAEYILGDESYLERILLAYLAPQVLLTPLWLRVAQRVQKKRLWLASMTLTMCGFVAHCFYSESTPALVIYAVPLVLGIGAAIGSVCALSIKADIIDYDEYVTGERKEGAYLAVWNLIRKGGSALPPMLALSLMGLSGYTPNAPQNEATLWVMRAFFGLFPAVCFLIGAALFLGFRFNRDEHARVRAEIAARGH